MEERTAAAAVMKVTSGALVNEGEREMRVKYTQLGPKTVVTQVTASGRKSCPKPT